MWRRYLLGNPVFLWRVMGERQGRHEPEPAKLWPVLFDGADLLTAHGQNGNANGHGNANGNGNANGHGNANGNGKAAQNGAAINGGHEDVVHSKRGPRRREQARPRR
jgi:hypothetical protein